MIDEGLYAKLRNTKSLPSPPAVAIRLLEAANDPEVSVADIVSVLEFDASLAAKVLRLARSPMYMRRYPPDTVCEAAMALGLNTVVSASLSFSLVPARRRADPVTAAHWKRSVVNAAAARAVAPHVGGVSADDATLIGLVSDIGMLALQRVDRHAYEELVADGDEPVAPTHTAVIDHERTAIGGDHAEISAWVLRSWRLPEWVVESVAVSHDGYDHCAPRHAGGRVAALASLMTDVVVDGATHAARAHDYAVHKLGLPPESVHEILSELMESAPALGALFDIPVDDPLQVMEDAQELLLQLQARVQDEQDRLREITEDLAHRTNLLEAQSRTDVLTGVASRRHLESVLDEEWERCGRDARPISVVFVDLDHFKRVNDTFGHQAGDRVLEATGRLLRRIAVPACCVGRYGGEEFVLVLPGADESDALAIAEAAVAGVREGPFDIGPGGPLEITASAGVATSVPRPGDDRDELVMRADTALYAAKRAGRDRVVGSDALAVQSVS